MKASPSLIAALSDINKVETTGQIRRIGAQMLLALARKEVSAADVEAASKMLSSMQGLIATEIKMHAVADALRERGATLGTPQHIGQMVIVDSRAA